MTPVGEEGNSCPHVRLTSTSGRGLAKSLGKPSEELPLPQGGAAQAGPGGGIQALRASV